MKLVRSIYFYCYFIVVAVTIIMIIIIIIIILLLLLLLLFNLPKVDNLPQDNLPQEILLLLNNCLEGQASSSENEEKVPLKATKLNC